MQSTMPCPRAGPSSDLLVSVVPSHPRPRASRQQSFKNTGHFDPDELTRRLYKVRDQRAIEERQREWAESRRRLQQQQQGRHVPSQAARQFSRTTTSASTLRAMQPKTAPEPPSPAMRYNQGLPVGGPPPPPAPEVQMQPFQFPFSTQQQQQQGGPAESSTDSTPTPPSIAQRFPVDADAVLTVKQTNPRRQPEWTATDSVASTVVGHVSVSKGAAAAAAARGSTPSAKEPAATTVWSPLLKKADSLWGLRGRASRMGSKGSLREMMGEEGGKGKGKMGAGEGFLAGEEGKKEGKRFFGKFRSGGLG
ncbi:hypothetical protein QBC39DRAFT_76956 [Podospora conica]|nr:hypothetical protein QBC39DRAFT_76956 [Schizothecium conicum]